MNIKEEYLGDVLVLEIESKDANFSISDEFKEFVTDKIAKGSVKILLSFKYVEYLDSSFLGALVSILKKLLTENGQIVITEANPDILSLFEVTRLDKVFVLQSSRNKALEELNG